MQKLNVSSILKCLFFLSIFNIGLCDWKFLIGPTYNEGQQAANYGYSYMPRVYSSKITPGSRNFAHVFHNEINNTVLTFGGGCVSNYSAPSTIWCLVDMWEYSLELNLWSYRYYLPYLGSCLNGSRLHLPYRYMNKGLLFEKTKIIMFGGRGYGMSLKLQNFWDDVWMYDMEEDFWEMINPGSTYNKFPVYSNKGEYGKNVTFGGRMYHYIFQLEKKPEIVYIWGGVITTFSNEYSDLFAYDANLNEFAYLGGGIKTEEEKSEPNPEAGVYNDTFFPNPRNDGSHFSFKDSLYIFGGRTYYNDEAVNDVWKFNTTLNMWMLLLEGKKQVINETGVFSPENWIGDKIHSNFWSYYDENEDDYFLFEANGWSSNEVIFYNDLWVFSLKKQQYMNIYKKVDSSFYVDFPPDEFFPNYLVTGSQLVINETAYFFFGFGYDSNGDTTRYDIVYSYEDFKVSICNGKTNFNEEVCSGNGVCKNSECICDENWIGEDCESIDCSERNQCNNRGTCIAPNECECVSGYGGLSCENNITILIVLFSGVGGFVVFVFIIILLGLLIIIFVTNVKQKKRLSKLEKIEGIDLIAEEQELAKKEGALINFKINQDLFKIDYKKINLKKQIGQGGGNAIVYLCEYEGRKLVFKYFSMRMFESEGKFQEFEREVSIISSVSHENVLRFFGASVNPPRIGYLMQYCENGDVRRFLKVVYKTKTGEEYSIEGRIKMLEQIASAMKHLHSLSIIHRDLKSENVLVDSSYNCQVMDFGLSKIYSNGKTMTKGIGTSHYMAPELILTNCSYDEKIDVFSFSIMIYEIITLDFDPYGKDSFIVQTKVARDGHYRPNFTKFKFVPSWIKAIAEQGWCDSPQKRPSFSEIYSKFRMIRQKMTIPSRQKRRLSQKEYQTRNYQ